MTEQHVHQLKPVHGLPLASSARTPGTIGSSSGN
jgi:hypothetical protein